MLLSAKHLHLVAPEISYTCVQKWTLSAQFPKLGSESITNVYSK